jgi:tetratricopeptide (TPR) repeat protein
MYPVRSCKRLVGVVLFVGLTVFRADGGEVPKLTDLGYEALGKGDWDAALARFDEAIRTEPKNAVAHQGLGLTYGMMGKLDLGIAELSKAIQLDPAEATAYRSRGSLYLFKGDYDHVIADCDEAIRHGLKDLPTYNNRGYAYLCKGSLEKAVSDLTEAIRLNPQRGTKAYANRGLAWYKLRSYDRAIADLSRAIEINHQSVEAFLIRASAYCGKGELDKALTDLDNAIRLDPGSTGAYRQRGSVHIAAGQIASAAADFTAAIRIAPEDSRAYLGRANCFSRQQQYDKALSDIDAAIKLKPSSPCSYEGRGVLWIERGDYDRGIADIETAIRLNPLDPAVNFETWTKAPVSEAALQHGKRQVRRMLQDRPVMGKYGEQARVLSDWAARKFAGEDFGRMIFWDSSELPPLAPSANYQQSAEEPGFIQLSKQPSNRYGTSEVYFFEELWCYTVFELYNISNSEDFRRLHTEASEGKLSKETFVAQIIECESRAAEKTRAFYIHVFMPWAKEHRLATHPALWFLAQRSEPTDTLLRFVTEKEPYWQVYGRQYDLIVSHSLLRKGENQKLLGGGKGGAEKGAPKAPVKTEKGCERRS